jgi:hypothetical protein
VGKISLTEQKFSKNSTITCESEKKRENESSCKSGAEKSFD